MPYVIKSQTLWIWRNVAFHPYKLHFKRFTFALVPRQDIIIEVFDSPMKCLHSPACAGEAESKLTCLRLRCAYNAGTPEIGLINVHGPARDNRSPVSSSVTRSVSSSHEWSHRACVHGQADRQDYSIRPSHLESASRPSVCGRVYHSVQVSQVIMYKSAKS